MENILIIGGSYFAGRVFVEKLLKQGLYNVFIFNRGNIPLPYKRLTSLVGDRGQPDHVRSHIPAEHWTAVIDFCAYSPEDVRSLLDNLPGSVGHYIFISTTSIYADTDDLPVTESAAKLLSPQPELGPYADYGVNKWLAECEVARLAETQNFHYTVLRPSIIYGRYNYAPRESYFFDLVQNNHPIVIPEKSLPLFSFVWVEDLAAVILSCLNEQRVFEDALNVCSPELISYRRLAQELEAISGRSVTIQEMPPAEIDRLRIPLPFPLDHHLIYSSAKIRETLDIHFTTFAEGMRQTWRYYQFQLARQSQSSAQ
ncbi:MAG: NAD-dependent epimerase/dehydratase family protein [Syntrophobacteraceae bacterium]